MEVFSPFLLAVLALLALSALVQIYYCLGVFSKLAFFKVGQNPVHPQHPVSVIMAARNESQNLQRNLPLLLEQDYPDFEVVVVNDCSWDSSQELLEEMEKQYPRLKVVNHIEQEKYPKGKKFALMLGIKAAKHDVLLFTDADCTPASKHWLAHMQACHNATAAIVLGYSPYRHYNKFLNLMIRFETFMTALLYFSYALKGKAYMGVGRNLSYTKSLFFKVKGFANHQHIMSGDDDLFVNETASNNNVAVQLHPESFMYSEPKKTWGDWMRQKARHMSTGKYYKTADKVRLGMYYGSLTLFYASLIAALVMSLGLIPVLQGIGALYLFRLLVQGTVFYLAAVRLQEKSLLFFLPLLDFIFIFYFLLTGLRALFIKPKVW